VALIIHVLCASLASPCPFSRSIFSIFFSLAFYFGFVYLYSAVGPEWIEGSDVGEYDFYYVPQNMFQVPTFWLVAALVSSLIGIVV